MTKPAIILATLALAIATWMLRYDMQAGSPASAAYVLDRWTGDVQWIVYGEIEPVVPKPAK